jgi:CheY-like chemotaxis protein
MAVEPVRRGPRIAGGRASPFPGSPTTDGAPRCDHGSVAGSILVVDDDTAVRGLVVRILRSWGHAVVREAGSVAEALSCAETLHPETVLVDIGLPDGDGFTLARELRTRFRVPRVVIFSSDADRANAAAAERAGAIAFLPKDELSSPALRRLLEGGTDGVG